MNAGPQRGNSRPGMQMPCPSFAQIPADSRRSWALLVGLCALLFATSGCAAIGAITDGEQHCVECSLRRHAGGVDLGYVHRRFRAGCDGGDARSCSVLGVMHESGRGVARDLPGAVRLFEKACWGGNEQGCVNLGRLYRDGAIGRPDPEGAELLFARACAAASPSGCLELGRIQAAAGQARSAAKSFFQACQSQATPEGCHELGDLYARAAGGSALRRAVRFYERACQGGVEQACAKLTGPPPATPLAQRRDQP